MKKHVLKRYVAGIRSVKRYDQRRYRKYGNVMRTTVEGLQCYVEGLDSGLAYIELVMSLVIVDHFFFL